MQVGYEASCDYRILNAREDFPAGLRLRLQERQGRLLLKAPLHGVHWALNVATAWAVCRELKLVSRRAASRVGRLQAPPGRMELRPWRGGWILDDSYNASPESYIAAVRMVQPLADQLSVRLVLGEMLELGSRSSECHREVAAEVSSLHPERVVALGTHISAALKATKIGFQTAETAEEAVTAGLADWRPGTLLLVKGAHGTGLYDALQEEKDRQ